MIELIISILIGAFAIIIAIYFGLQSKYLFKEIRRISWDELRLAARELRKKIEKEFHPDLIFVPCKRGATIVNLMYDVEENVQLFVGNRLDKRRTQFSLPKNWRQQWAIVETGKYKHLIPRYLLNLLKENKNRKILIIDDFTMTGDSIEKIKELMEKEKIPSDNIKTAAIVATYVSYEGKGLPDFYWLITAYKVFYFPWGKAV